MNLIPCCARMSNVSRSTAVSGNHMPSGFLPKRCSKSRMPQIACVVLSREFASGIIMWLCAWLIAEPCPPNASALSRSAFRID